MMICTIPILCPDSKVTAKFKCKRTKMTCTAKNALASTKLVELLKKSHFSVIIDETTYISVCKQLVTVTRVYDEEVKKVQCDLLDLVQLDSSNTETLVQTICGAFEKDVMFGEHNSVASRLKEKIPHIFILCDAYCVIVHIFVHHMIVESSHGRQKICYTTCTIILP